MTEGSAADHSTRHFGNTTVWDVAETTVMVDEREKQDKVRPKGMRLTPPRRARRRMALDVVPEHLAVALDASTMWMMINV